MIKVAGSSAVNNGRMEGRSVRASHTMRSGTLTEQTYPSGRVVKNFLEVDGDLSSMPSRMHKRSLKNYAANFSYTPLELG